MANQDTFDFIIVGAGSSGAVLAVRLSEDPSIRVLLLEAGSDYRSADSPQEMRSANPLAIMNPVLFPEYAWPELLVRRTPQQEPRIYDRGKGPGGSSAINWQVAHRPELEDLDWWAEQGCVGWSGEQLLPALNRLENDLDYGDAPYHGNRGPITIARPPVSQWGKVDLALLEYALDHGHPWADDLNAPESTGICPTPINRTAENRVSTNDGYLEPARDRSNLVIKCDCLVDRVIFRGSRAVGVETLEEESRVEYAGNEVILAAGSTFSPPILMRSGIGPEDQLRALGIPVRANLPVGQNLTDHSSVSVLLKLNELGRAASWEQRHSSCYVRYSSAMCGAGRNDMVLSSRNLGAYSQEGLLFGSMTVILWQTFSRGELRIVSPDPTAMPLIEENLVGDDRDLTRLRNGARDLFELVQSRSVQAIADEVILARGVMDATDDKIADLKDDRALDDWIRRSARDTWHLIGTCRMGAADDPRTVVDPECRVLGVDNLRVIDGSIMPDVPRANTNLTCIAIGEHMAPKLRRTKR